MLLSTPIRFAVLPQVALLALALLPSGSIAEAAACRGYKTIERCDRGDAYSNGPYCAYLIGNPEYQQCLLTHQDPPQCSMLMGKPVEYQSCMSMYSAQSACAFLSLNPAYQRCITGQTAATPARCVKAKVPCDDRGGEGAVGEQFHADE